MGTRAQFLFSKSHFLKLSCHFQHWVSFQQYSYVSVWSMILATCQNKSCWKGLREFLLLLLGSTSIAPDFPFPRCTFSLQCNILWWADKSWGDMQDILILLNGLIFSVWSSGRFFLCEKFKIFWLPAQQEGWVVPCYTAFLSQFSFLGAYVDNKGTRQGFLSLSLLSYHYSKSRNKRLPFLLPNLVVKF